jgi:hypothetical protein
MTIARTNPIFARFATLVQQYRRLRVRHDNATVTFDLRELLPLEQVVVRTELHRVVDQLRQIEAETPVAPPVAPWRISILSADEPFIVEGRS